MIYIKRKLFQFFKICLDDWNILRKKWKIIMYEEDLVFKLFLYLCVFIFFFVFKLGEIRRVGEEERGREMKINGGRS